MLKEHRRTATPAPYALGRSAPTPTATDPAARHWKLCLTLETTTGNCLSIWKLAYRQQTRTAGNEPASIQLRIVC